MKDIDGKAKTVREILKDQRYSIDYYQREYRWQRKQILELIDDLTEQFLDSYSDKDGRQDVEGYEHYFLGSIILSKRDGKLFIVDGQQRLTTLTLLLMVLNRRQNGRPDRSRIEDLIYSEKYGTHTFNIDVPERAIIMDALFKGEAPDVNGSSESVQTIAARYLDLEDLFPEEIDERALPFFCDWLIDNVHLVAITATTDEDAYTIFETMNDRGLSLTPLDMLKGYLLSNIKDASKRDEAAKAWRKQIELLRNLGKDEDSDAVKTWLRARYAENVRERHRGAENRDFERIGTEFHRWVNDHAELLGLKESDDFFRFVHQEMPFYTRQYHRLREASQKPVKGLEPVYHVACYNFTLQYPLLLAPLLITDDPATIDRKIRLVANFLDILLARRAVNYLTMTFAAMSYAIFLIMKEVRGKSVPELAKILRQRLDEQGCDFDGTKDGMRKGFAGFELNQWSKRYIKVLLARMTAFVERQSGVATSSVANYMVEGKNRFEVEHIWAYKPERHRDEFDSNGDFAVYRNRIGGLLLLPKDFNASYGDLTYAKKLPHYYAQNLLVRSLCSKCYSHNPGFARFIMESGLPFAAHDEFKKADLDSRGQLYRQLADVIWNPDVLFSELDG